MLRLINHGLTAFVATLAFFVVLAIVAWIAVGYGVAIIVAVAAAIFVAIALPLLHLRGQRLLRDEEPLRRAREVELLRHGDEGS